MPINSLTNLRRISFLSIVCSALVISAVSQSSNLDQFGNFTGTLKLQPSGDGVHMTVLETYSYADPDHHTLVADPGFSTDGASIPRALWTIVGSPFTGKYIGAAVIHDVGCDTHKYSWQITHRMFYTAMLELGVSETYAKLLYWGVRLGGPKWDERRFSADSIDHLRQSVQAATGRALDDKLITRNDITVPNGSYNGVPTYSTITRYAATLKFPTSPSISLSPDQASRIDQYIKQRSISKSGPVSLDEIDKNTPLTGPLPPDAIPN
jgi:hypothetical protein